MISYTYKLTVKHLNESLWTSNPKVAWQS